MPCPLVSRRLASRAAVPSAECTPRGPGYRTCKRAPADTTTTPPRRLGVLDASEIPPTYSAPSDKFIALIAGGDYALRNAKEGAEDSRSGAEEDLRPYGFDPDVDSLIGIASSGRTPYVLGGLEHVRRIGGATVAVVCVQPSAVQDEGNADRVIAAVTGPESVTGSTRMKAGTATKLVLNMISTGIMIKLGKTYGNLVRPPRVLPRPPTTTWCCRWASAEVIPAKRHHGPAQKGPCSSGGPQCGRSEKLNATADTRSWLFPR